MKALFLGSKEFGLQMLACLRRAVPAVDWCMLHPDDSGDPRSALVAFRTYADQMGIDLQVTSSAKAAHDAILLYRPDIIFVCGWYWLLDAELLDSVPRGVFGIHNSLLPKYRGSAPLVWSIINGDSEVGATVFRFTPGMDDGGVLLQVRVDNAPQDTVASLLTKIEAALQALLPTAWRALLEGNLDLAAQDESLATYCGQRLPGDGLIDWSRPASAVHDFIRAQTPPYPGAVSFANGEKFTFLRSAPDTRTYFGTPGQVLARESGGIVVSCGNATAIKIAEMAGEDGQCREAATLIRSITTRFGSAFQGS